MDLSSYNPDVEPTNNFIEVWQPNYTNGIRYEYIPLTNTIVNSASLGLTSTITPCDLGDGLWIIKQSTCPNETNYLIKNHLRIINTKRELIRRVEEAIDNWDEKEIEKLWKLIQDIELAKLLVDDGCVDKGVALYNSVTGILTDCQNC
jgi:hypothetical protein